MPAVYSIIELICIIKYFFNFGCKKLLIYMPICLPHSLAYIPFIFPITNHKTINNIGGTISQRYKYVYK